MFERIKILFRDEIKIIAKDHSIFLTVIIAPLLYAFFLGSIYIYKDESKVKFGVVDMDRTETSRTIVRILSATEKIDLINELDDFNAAVEKVNSFEIQGFLFIPHNFEKNLKKINGADVILFVNNTKFLPTNDVTKTVMRTLMTAGAGIRLRYYQARKGMTTKEAMTQIMPLIPEIRMLYNPTANYGDFLLPGLFLLILHQTLLIGFGESIALTRQKKKIKEWFNKAGGKISLMILGKSSFYFVLFSSLALFFFTVVFRVFEINFGGNVFAIIALTFFFLLSVMFYTIFLGSLFKSQARLMEIFAFTTYPIFLTTGYSWPLQAMPEPVQLLAQFVPLTHYYQGIIKVAQMHAPFSYVAGDLINLVALSMFAYLLAYFRLKRLVKKESLEP